MLNAISRRALLSAGATLASVAPLGATDDPKPSPTKLKIAIFSKHLRFLEGATLAESAAEMGFDGIDLAVRKGGHIEPDRVAHDLPPLVSLIRSHGLEVPMVTTDIMFAETPCAEDILKAMAALGIRRYRWGGFKYVAGRTIVQQLSELRPRVERLSALNSRYEVTAMYHTHSGIDLVGASIWDLHELLDGLDPASVGINYDIGHATIEGGLGGWINSFRISQPHLRGIAVKDFLWQKDQQGQWRVAWQPLGQGMVKFHQFLAMVAQTDFSGPLQLHFEYPLGGADSGSTALTIPREDVFRAMKQDLRQLRSYLKDANLV
jgi:sugar phosphate isomerase/epimerase